MANQIALPVVHVGGTSKAALLEGCIDCVNALRHAIEVVQSNAPNGRDYYPSREHTIGQAMAEHRTRVEKLESVLAEIRQIGEHVGGLS